MGTVEMVRGVIPFIVPSRKMFAPTGEEAITREPVVIRGLSVAETVSVCPADTVTIEE